MAAATIIALCIGCTYPPGDWDGVRKTKSPAATAIPRYRQDLLAVHAAWPAKPMARPVWTPTDAQRRQAETMAAYGIPEADIARVLGVSKPTLRKHCGTELDTGATRANSKVADFLFYGICGGTGKPAFKDERARVTAAIFWMKTRGGWSETSTHKHTGAANGDPIEVEVVSVRERLTRRIARIAAAKTTGDVPETDE